LRSVTGGAPPGDFPELFGLETFATHIPDTLVAGVIRSLGRPGARGPLHRSHAWR
jgi:hypothetical protein